MQDFHGRAEDPPPGRELDGRIAFNVMGVRPTEGLSGLGAS
jgi:hypothetical protein